MAVPSIKNPCPEKWEGMTPENQGRFCGKCSKIVIDFTKKTTQEIIDFLTARNGEDVCGKLRKPALIPVSTSPESNRDMLRLKSSRMKLFAAALYLTFGSLLFTACGPPEDEEPVGKVALDSTEQAENQRYLDSLEAASAVTKTTMEFDSTDVMDSTDMMRTMNILDSIRNSKNK